MKTKLCDVNYKPKFYDDLIYFDPECGNPKVIGYKKDVSDSGSDYLYALAACFPKFNSKGYMVLPSVSLKDDCSSDAMFLQSLKRKKEAGTLDYKTLKEIAGKYRGVIDKNRLIRNKQNHPLFAHEMFMHLDVAHYLFKKIGIQVSRGDLKLILTWNWG